MREYRYKALPPGGELITGFRRAADAAALESALSAGNLVLLDSRVSLHHIGRSLRLRSKRSQRDLMDFTLHMATCLTSGIPVLQALRDIEETLGNRPFAEVARAIREDVAAGSQLADALTQHPDAFPETYVAVLHAGENSGSLEGAFEELVRFLEWHDDLRGKVTQALTYPAILATATLGLFLLILLYAIPRFAEAFNDLDFELPALTRQVLGFGDVFASAWPWLLAGLVLLVAGTHLLRRTDRGRYRMDDLFLRLPVIGGFARKLALSRMARSFAMLIRAGIDVIRMLGLLQRVVGNRVYAVELASIREQVLGGSTLAEAFERSGRFPPLIRRLLAVGERTGKLDLTLGKAAEHMDKELPRALRQLFTFMEAGVIVVLGAIVVTTALAMLLPIFTLESQIGGM